MAGLDDVDQRGWPLPSRRVSARLRRDERLVAATRQHWVKPAWALAVPTAVAGLLIWLAAVLPPGTTGLLDLGWIVWLGLVVRMGWKLWGWSVSWFAVTDERLLLSYGRLTHKLAMMPLSKVTDMTYVRTSVGQTLGFGEFVLESAGQDQALHRVRLLPRSQLLYDQIYDQLARRDRAAHAGREGRATGAAGARGRGAAPPPDSGSRGERGAGREGVEAVRVTRSGSFTRAGRAPEPVTVHAGDATQVVDTGPSAPRPARAAAGQRREAVRDQRDQRDQRDEQGGGDDSRVRRAWSAVRGGVTPSLPTAPTAPSGPARAPDTRAGSGSRSGRAATSAPREAGTTTPAGGHRGGVVGATRGLAARLWASVRGGDGTPL